MQSTLLPEWADQEAILLAWPDSQTDWANWLGDAQQTYVSLIEAINHADLPVVLLARKSCWADITDRLHEGAKVMLVAADYNDTWIRDYGFLTCQTQAGMQPVSFTFNGWGQKFDASKDNLINETVLAALCKQSMKVVDLVAEGGALEIDAEGNLLSTALCLLNPKRNDTMALDDYRSHFSDALGCQTFTVLEHGHLEGDDTDGHIDTLARFTPSQGLVIQSAYNRESDPLYAGLTALVEECQGYFPQHSIFELPLPDIKNDDGDRLPASYANFLIANQHVFCPVYSQPEDAAAINMIQQAYPEFTVIAINCATLVQQYGSLHCISMQIPRGTLKDAIIDQLSQGVTTYG